jgi:hypothetical protein
MRRLAVLLVVVTTAVAVGADEAPTFEIAFPDASISIGDRLPVRVTARGGEDLLWGELDVGVEPDGAWALIDGPRDVSGSRPPSWELVLAPMEVGEIEMPPMAVVVRAEDGKPFEVTAAGLPAVDVVSVLPPDEEVDPVALRGPMGVRGFPWEWVVPLAVPVIGLAAMIAYWRRRRHSEESASVPVLAPFDEFDDLLRRLEGRVGSEPAEGVCDRLAGGLRRYLERRSGEPAAEMTSFEMRLLVRQLGWPEASQRGIQQVMNTVDLVRFGRTAIEERELRRAIESSRDSASRIEALLRQEEESAAEAAG